MCVREIKKAMKKPEIPQAADLFSGMPPLEAVKALLSIFVGHCQEATKGNRALAMYVISRAHFHGVPVRRLFIELPEEEKEDVTDGKDYVGIAAEVHAWHGGCLGTVAGALCPIVERGRIRAGA